MSKLLQLVRQSEGVGDLLAPHPRPSALGRAQVLDRDEEEELEQPHHFGGLGRQRRARLDGLGEHRTDGDGGQVGQRRAECKDMTEAVQVHRPGDLRAEHEEKGEQHSDELVANGPELVDVRQRRADGAERGGDADLDHDLGKDATVVAKDCPDVGPA